MEVLIQHAVTADKPTMFHVIMIVRIQNIQKTDDMILKKRLVNVLYFNTLYHKFINSKIG